jgi:tetraacyldisaccharide 4'-kinase
MYYQGNLPPPSLIKILLNPVSFIFKTISLINLEYKSLACRKYGEATIISVDNLSFGGTGKTPLVMAIGRALRAAGIPFAVVSRGYRSQYERLGIRVLAHHTVAEIGDEARMLGNTFPGQDIFIGRDRHLSIKKAIARHNRVIILDDGFQSTDIHKDLRIMLFNPAHPYYYLRNFKYLVDREDIILYYGCRPAGTDWGKGPLKGTYTFEIESFCDRQGQVVDLAGARLFGFSALGDNRRFERDLGGFSGKGFRPFKDHHVFSQAEIYSLDQARQAAQADFLVCTEKDFVRLADLVLTGIPFIFARNRIKLSFDLAGKILELCRQKR